MKFRIGIENNNEGFRSIAWALEHPGCYAYGGNEQEAITNSGKAIQEYAKWIEKHETSWLPSNVDIETHIEQVWMDYDVDKNLDRVEKGEYTVEPFFDHDWKPLTTIEIERGLKLLSWSHAGLLSVLEKLTPEQWATKKEGERWDIVGIVRHIGGAEWWYLERLGRAFPQAELPRAPMERIEKVRVLMNEMLPTLKDVNQVVGLDGELWSPRKMLRRALWHERDHTEHIQKLI